MHAAACIGSYFGLSIEVIANAIAAYEPDNNRSQLSHIAKNWYVMDAYNANPSSMSAAIKNFLAMEQNPKILVLGDMLELGDVAFEEHKRIIEEACLGNAKEIITVGPLFKEADINNKTTQLEDAGAVREYILNRGFSNHYFLVKGSRRIGLEKIVADL
jgi:UDP-N-acetylmuramoyl-tripeptide--D-alanyl-D-alanine ligase